MLVVIVATILDAPRASRLQARGDGFKCLQRRPNRIAVMVLQKTTRK